MTADPKQEELKQLTAPVIEWLNANYHPHVLLIVESTGFQLHELQFGLHTLEHVKG